MIKKIIFTIIILSLFTPIIYADTYSELIDKILYINKQKTQREPIKIEIKKRDSGENITYIYITSVMKVKEIKPKDK